MAITAETIATAFARHSPQHDHHKEYYTCDETIDHLNNICVKLRVHSYPEEEYGTFKSWATTHHMQPPLSSSSSSSFHSRLFTKAAAYLSQNMKQDAILTLSDLPSTAVHLLKNNPPVLEHVRRQYTHVFVDEFQDACKDQLELMLLLVPNVTIVGDPKQSIYGFRNALPNALDAFYKKCIESRGYEPSVFTLHRNYRSSPSICAFASELLLGKHGKLISARPTTTEEPGGKAFPPVSVVQHQSDEEEAEAIADSIAQGISNGSFLPKNIAILYRCLNSNNNTGTTRSSYLVEKALQRRNINYIVAMSSQRDNTNTDNNDYGRQEGKALLAFLILLADPEDDAAWHAVLTLPHLGLTSATLEVISEMYRESILHQRESSLYHKIRQVAAASSSASDDDVVCASDGFKLEQVLSMVVDIRQELLDGGGLQLQQLIKSVITHTGLLLTSRRKDDDDDVIDGMSQEANSTSSTRSISSSPILAAIIEEAARYHHQSVPEYSDPSSMSISTLHSFLAYLSTDVVVSEIERGSYSTDSTNNNNAAAAGISREGSCITTTQELASGALALDQNAAVLITTMHSAKGLEWKAVYLPHVNKDMLRRRGGDGDRDGDEEDARRAYYEEEARLLHVAATRAERYLSVTYVQKYYETKEEYTCDMMMDAPVVSPLLVPAIEKLKMQPHIMYFKGQLLAPDDDDDACYSTNDGSIITFGTTTNDIEDDSCVESNREKTYTGRVLTSTQTNTNTPTSSSSSQQPRVFKYKLASTARGAFKPPRPMKE